MKITTAVWQKTAISLTAFLLVLIFLFTGLGAPGFLLDLFRNDNTLTAAQTAKPETGEPLGHSQPISINVDNFFFLDAAENTFARNTDVKVKELSERKMDKLQKTLEGHFPDAGAAVVWAWDVDAGMDPEEHTPGSFHLSVDLAQLSVPEEYMDNFFLLRVDDDGNWFRYAAERKDSRLTAESRQNSIVTLVMVIGGVALPIGNRIIPAGENMGYKRYAKSFLARQHVVYEKYGDKSSKPLINICYPPDDVFESLEKKLAIKKYDAFHHFKQMDKKKIHSIIAERIHCDPSQIGDKTRRSWYQPLADEQLRKDPEYQKLLKEVEDHKNLIGNIGGITGLNLVADIGKQALDAYNHVKNTCGGIRMPSYVVDIHLVNSAEGFTGVTVSSPIDWLKNPYICLNTFFYDGENGKSYLDGVLLTITHEMLHVCQREYKNGSFACLKFDEAMAQLLELESRAYFRRKGIISTPQPNTDKNYVRTDLFALPLDAMKVTYGNSLGGEEASFKPCKATDTSKAETGYPLARLLLFLRNKHRKDATYHELLLSYLRYTRSPKLTELLKDCFYLSDEQLTADYLDFAVRSRSTLLKLAEKKKAPWSVMQRPVKFGEANPVTVTNHDYTIRFHRFMPEQSKKKGPWKLLIATDPSFYSELPDVMIYPVGDWKGNPQSTVRGILSAQQNELSQDGYAVMEADGGTAANGWIFDKKSKLMAFILEVPDVKDTKVKKTGVEFRLPPKSPAAKAGCTDGYTVKITAEGGKPYIEHYPISKAGKKILVPFEAILPKDFKGDAEKLPITLQLQEDMMRKDNDRAYGPAAILPLNGGAQKQEEEPEPETPDGEGRWTLTGVKTFGDKPGVYEKSYTIQDKTSMGRVTDDYTYTGTIQYTYGQGSISYHYRVTAFEGFTSKHEGPCTDEYAKNSWKLTMLPKHLPNRDAVFEVENQSESTSRNCYMAFFQPPNMSVYWSDAPNGYGEIVCASLKPAEVQDLKSLGTDGPIRGGLQKHIYRFHPDPDGTCRPGDKRYLVINYYPNGGAYTTAYEFTCS